MVTTPHYDLDIDTTLGGNNASDYIIPSQKAIKSYVDNNTGSTVDQTYDPTSQAAQSGLAIAGAGFLTSSSLNGYIQNTATGNGSLTIQGTSATYASSINIGSGSSVSNAGVVAIGHSATVASGGSGGVIVGQSATVGQSSPDVVLIGTNTTCGTNSSSSTAIGGYASIGNTVKSAIQIGRGTNSTSNTLSIGFYNAGTNYQLLDGTTGLIPDARISTNMARTSDVNNSIMAILASLYPIGSVYIGTMATCPLQTLGIGTWQLVSSGRVLQGSDSNNVAGSTVNASLPSLTTDSQGDHSHNRGTMNISGGPITVGRFTSTNNTTVGALSTKHGMSRTTGYDTSRTSYDSVLTLTASSNWTGTTNTTGSHTHTAEWTDHVGTTVQPDAYIVNIWERIA